MLVPRKIKFRKQHHPRRTGAAKGGTRLAFGDYGIQAMESAYLTNRQIESARIAMRLPKLRGFKNPFREEYQIVNLDRLSQLFPDGGAVDVADLVAAGAVRRGTRVKILGSGDLSIALQVSAHAFSASAKEKITAAGGSATEL